jgi:hypothetical protein
MFMKPKIFVVCMVFLLLASCNLPSPATPAPFKTPVIVATSTSAGGVVTQDNVSFRVPLGVATSAQAEKVAAVTDPNNSPWWEVAPDHLKFTLTGYQVPTDNTPLQPQIFVYPADEYAKLNSNAADQIQKVKTILAGGPLTKDTLPSWIVNAAQIFTAKAQVIPFQNGRGVRFLTQYDQYPAPINNRELVYHFQGLTDDGKYYIVALLPVTSSILAADEKPESPVPSGGVPLPAGGGPDQAYYDAVTKALDAMYEDSFNPSLFQLDALIQSITVTP